MDPQSRFKIREFLKVNLTTLQGEALGEFVGRYDIGEINSVQMMILDASGSDKFIALPNPAKAGHYYIATEDTLEKILLLAPLDPETEGMLKD